MIANNPASNMSTFKKLLECLENIDCEMSNKQYFLLGFFTCTKYQKNKNSIENSNFMDIYNEFLCEFIIENKHNIFEINEPILVNNPNLTEAYLKKPVKLQKGNQIVQKSFNSLSLNLLENLFKRDSYQNALIENNEIKNNIELTCNICNNNFLLADLENYWLDCGHYMHFECFRTYIQYQVKKIK